MLVYLYMTNYTLTEYLMTDAASSKFFIFFDFIVINAGNVPNANSHTYTIVLDGKSMFRVISEDKRSSVLIQSQNSFLFVCFLKTKQSAKHAGTSLQSQHSGGRNSQIFVNSSPSWSTY